jgi:dolichyl-phosphate beta-glucosyltransferase
MMAAFKSQPDRNPDLDEGQINDSIILVVPCFNEEKRWEPQYWKQVGGIAGLKLYFVNDGSSDGTSAVIRQYLKDTSHVLIELPSNLGKAEAIRNGFVQAFTETPLGIGFLDADGAFPVIDVLNQVNTFRKKQLAKNPPVAVWSSRVQLAGRSIERKLLRHYLARVIVTLLANRFTFTIYDTQCGLKIFPLSRTLMVCTEEKFHTRWFFDLEIFLKWRLETGSDMEIWEEPLFGWKDVGGSKLSGMQYWNIVRDLCALNKYK